MSETSIISPDSHSFCQFIECYFDGDKIEAVCRIDARTGQGVKLALLENGDPVFKGDAWVTEEFQCDAIRLRREANTQVRNDWARFVKAVSATTTIRFES